MTATVSILARRRDSVLLVPNSAIRYEKDRPYVEVIRDGQPQTRPVTLGLDDGAQAEVVEGLAEGDQVTVGTAATKWSNAARTTQPAVSPRPGGGPAGR
jgi:multidrug efflux pump subunit AcrA (membrane-fusion protein)